jgi:hypothetical protein
MPVASKRPDARSTVAMETAMETAMGTALLASAAAARRLADARPALLALSIKNYHPQAPIC